MAQTPSDSGSSNPTALARGKACLRCRKRKMRCDGVKPACAQCVRARKGEACQYDDGKGKTRTQALREKILQLEEKIQQMQDPDYTSPSITLHDPHTHLYSSSSSSSASGSPISAAASVAQSPYSSFGASQRSLYSRALLNVFSSEDSPQAPWAQPREFTPPLVQQDELPLELSQTLFDIVVPHRHQCGLVLHPERLRASLSMPPSERRHPVLMNAIFLWSCFLSRPGSLSQHEQHYLSRAQDSLSDALTQSNRIVDVIQASCLLSKYLFACGRLVEASYHASAAATLAVHVGLHRVASLQPPVTPWSTVVTGSASLFLDPPMDVIELGERISVFWQAFCLDRCLAAALQRPSSIIDDDSFMSKIDTPWPENIEEYATISSETILGDSTLRMYFAHRGQPTGVSGGFSIPALRAKASALYEGATRLAEDWGYSSSPKSDYGTFELMISRFLTSLMPVQQLDATVPDDRRSLVMLHTLAHAATIQLHQRFARDDPTSLDKCLRAARGIVAVIKRIGEVDYEFLDPIMGVCWTTAAGILALEQLQVEGAWATAVASEYQQDLDTIICGLTKLGARFPLASFQLSKVMQTLIGTPQ